MKLVTSKLFARLGNQFNCNVLQFLNKEWSPLSLSNITNTQRRYKGKLSKPALFVPPTKCNNFNKVHEKIGVYGYFLLSLPVAAFMLGTWQIQRRKWKLNLLEALNKCTTMEPIELPENVEDLELKEYYPVKVKGTFQYENEFIVGPRSLIIDGQPADHNSALIGKKDTQNGYCVITPFKLIDRDLTILVNRGWIPRTLRNSAERQQNQVKGVVEITGIVRLNEKRPQFLPKNSVKDNVWYYRDVYTMAELAGTAPVYIDMTYNENFPQYPTGGQTHVKLRNEHWSYIITWYSLSAVTGYMWYKHFIKKMPIVI